jgi:ubiquinone/menaquinone biosynthesis C-methylase UbiE
LEDGWERLFDELYLRTYAAVQRDEDAEPLALGAMRLAGCEAGADVLDAACGYGRHSRVLAKAGYRTVGLDRSSVLLDEARHRTEGAEWPRWVEGDYRDLPFEAGSFDAVVNVFTSFGFFSEDGDLQMLTEFRRVLRPGGSLVLETMHRDRLMAIFQEQDWQQLPDNAVWLERRSFDSVSGICEVALTYWPKGEEPVAHQYRLRIYTPGELKRMAVEAGFAEIDFYGDPEGGPLTRDSRLVLVGRTPRNDRDVCGT